MKKFLFLSALVLAVLQVTAANVDLATAKQSAQRFLTGKTVQGRFNASAPTIKWTHEEKNSSNVAQAAYYIVNTERGFVIIGGDDRANEILAYGDQPLESLNDLPDGMQYFLNLYKTEMEYLQSHPGLVVKKSIKSGGASVEPMLQTAWAQGRPYFMRCPKIGSSYPKVGCMAVALSQVMRYWEYPATAPAMDGYTTKTSNINVPALPEYPFDWENMLDTYERYSSNSDQLPEVNKDAIAWLMRYAGQAMHMDYGVVQSGAGNLDMLDALETFGYEGVQLVKKCDSKDFDEDTTKTGIEFYNDEQWGELIQAELRAGRPLIYCANAMSSDSTSINGHAFNIDGYDAANDLYHVNFGMSSDKNAYYALNAFKTGEGLMQLYDFWPIFYSGVQAPGATSEPRIVATPMDLTVECYAGETATATVTVSGTNLTGDITVTVTDENGVFTADAATVTIAEAAEGKTVTVTYAPTVAGTHNATITLTSDGAVDKVVSIMGTATVAPLVVYAPVMQPAAEQYINETSFRADWTDQTVAENVVSYTLEVKEKPTTGGVIAEVDFSDQPKQSGNKASTALEYLPEGWGYAGYDFYFDEAGFVEISKGDYIMTNGFSGYDKVTVVVTAKDYFTWGNSSLTVSTSVASETFETAADVASYTVVLDCGETDNVKVTAGRMVYIQSIKVYAGEVTAPQLRQVEESGDAAYRLIKGITDKFYTVTGLNANSTYTYKVKALYTDNTESAWSNTETVTLKAGTVVTWPMGDVNHDGKVDVADVSMVINYVLGKPNTDTFYGEQADVTADDKIDVADVSDIINIVLGKN